MRFVIFILGSMAIGMVPNFFFGFTFKQIGWWAITIPLSVLWVIIDSTILRCICNDCDGCKR